MASNNWKNKISNLDGFWDLDSLIVKKGIGKKQDTIAEKTNSSPTLYEIKSEEKPSSTTIKRYVIPKAPKPRQEIEREYEKANSLIQRVKIYSWSADYNYYEDFSKDVKRYFNVYLERAEKTPFFSYVPQYSQMNRKQSEWYFYFRHKARAGEFLDCDYSYILLYCFELINSGGLEDPGRIIMQLANIWKHYHKTYPQLNKYLSEWICDFGLLYDVDFPRGVLGDELNLLMQASTLKEYYASSVYEDKDSFVKVILEFCSGYDYKKSRYYSENSRIYDDYIEKLLAHLFDCGLLQGFSTERCTIVRQAFISALAPYDIKKKIEIQYCSFSRTNEFRYVVGDIIKYAENKIRAHLSIKSRLSVYSISDDVKRIVDAFSGTYFERAPKKKKENVVVMEYEKLYDVPRKEFSISDAHAIEDHSWLTTKRLVEAFEGDEEKVEVEIAEKKREDTPLSKYAKFLSYALENDYEGQRRFAKENGAVLDALADEINEIASEIYGDILLEEADFGYLVIEDYIEIVKGEINGK